MKIRIFIFVILSVTVLYGRDIQAAERLSFDQVWKLIKENSPALLQTQQEKEAAQVAVGRSKRAVLPSAQMGIHTFTTNDAGKTLFSNLGERSVIPADFVPATLNNPGYGVFSKGTLQVNLPLYEGGMINANKKASKLQSLSKTHAHQFNTDYLYATHLAQYALLISASATTGAISALNKELDVFSDNYQLNNSKSPVGRSGELGLKALKNRLKGMMNQTEAEKKAFKISLSQQAGLTTTQWNFVSENVVHFLKRKFGSLNKNKIPYSVTSIHYASQAMKENAKREKSALLPHAGLFSEFDVYKGSRNMDSSATMGAYIKWNALIPSQYGAQKEKMLEAKAMESMAKSESDKAMIDAQQTQESVSAIVESLGFMQSSLNILKEQTTTTDELYKNGLINILQIVDLLNRRADLIGQIHEAEKQLCMDYAKNFVQGGSNEF